MERIKCAVIGLGWFGEQHVDTLTELPLAELAAVCTRTETRLAEIADRYNVKKRYTDYHELLNDKEIDMVSIVTHVPDHYKIAVDAIRAGKHVFLEKPMANSAQECDLILKELEKSDKAFMVGHICRFDTAYAMAKEEIESGRIGKIISMHSKRNLAGWITETHLDKISALFGDGIHDLDLMMWYVKSKPKSVYAQTMNTRKPLKYDDISWALYRFENDAFGVVESIWSLPDNVPYAINAEMEIIGSEGMIKIDNSGSNFSIITKDGVKFPESKYWPKVHGMKRGFLKEEFDYFLKCIAENKKVTVITPQESRDVVYAIRVAEQSAKENKVINF